MATVGEIVLYRLSAIDAERIRERRANNIVAGSYWNGVLAGEILPMVVVKVWPNEFGARDGANGQVFLDGSDTLWVTSAHDVGGVWTCEWPVGVIASDGVTA